MKLGLNKPPGEINNIKMCLQKTQQPNSMNLINFKKIMPQILQDFQYVIDIFEVLIIVLEVLQNSAKKLGRLF